MKTLIAGAGIGGLTAAVALARDGHQVTVMERSMRFGAVGAGIILGPNAIAVLSALGVDASPVGHPLPALRIIRADGTPLFRLRAEDLPERFGPAWGLARQDLHETLLAALPGDVRVLAGHTVGAVRQAGGEVEVRCADDRPAERFDLVVGADGLRSAVRAAVHGPLPLRYSGVTCWRGMIDNPGHDSAIEAWGRHTRIGVVPLRDGRMYYYLVMTAPRLAPEPQWPTGFRRAFAEHRAGPLAGFVAALNERPPLHHDLEELGAPVWGDSRVLLLGDAAHAMTPNQGQGAGMAIEDAYALARALAPGADGAARRYRELRHRRVRAMQRNSRRTGAIAQLRNPLARAARDGVLPAIPFARFYRRQVLDPAAELLRAPGTARPPV